MRSEVSIITYLEMYIDYYLPFFSTLISDVWICTFGSLFFFKNIFSLKLRFWQVIIALHLSFMLLPWMSLVGDLEMRPFPPLDALGDAFFILRCHWGLFISLLSSPVPIGMQVGSPQKNEIFLQYSYLWWPSLDHLFVYLSLFRVWFFLFWLTAYTICYLLS